MALSDGATVSSGIAGGIGMTIGDAVVAFNKTNVFLPLVTSKQAAQGSGSVEFSDWAAVALADVPALTEGTAGTAQALTTAARTATISEHGIQVDITDLSQMGYGAGSLKETAGAVIGNAVAMRLDDDIANLFAAGSLTNNACGAGTPLALSHIFDCLRLLNANGAPAPLNLALGTKQVWGAKGVRKLVTDVAVTGSNAKPYSSFGAVQGQELASNGFVTRLAGFDVYTSPQITEISGDDEEGCAFSSGAFGVGIGVEGLIRIEEQRNAAKRATEMVATGFWGETMIKDLFAVSLTSDVS
tara:strand:- start:1399 stop:2298 length:900 start_codon:yes stop_codon:yes gene_type:complete